MPPSATQVLDALLRIPARDAPSALSLHFSGTAEGVHGRAFAVDFRYYELESERCGIAHGTV